MRKISLAVTLTATALTGLWLAEAAETKQPAAVKPDALKHVVVFQEAGRYGGWPANQGAWSWGNELLVGFDDGEFNVKQSGHTLTRTVGPKQRLARSKDGGETWSIEEPDDLRLPKGVNYQSTYPPGEGRELTDPPGG